MKYWNYLTLKVHTSLPSLLLSSFRWLFCWTLSTLLVSVLIQFCSSVHVHVRSYHISLLFLLDSLPLTLLFSFSFSRHSSFDTEIDMHENGYVLHRDVHHVTLGGVVTSPIGERAHAVVHLRRSYVQIERFGAFSSLSSSFNLEWKRILYNRQ